MRMFTTPSSLPICTRPRRLDCVRGGHRSSSPSSPLRALQRISGVLLLPYGWNALQLQQVCQCQCVRCIYVCMEPWKRTARVRTSTSVLMSSTHYICNFIKDVCSVILIFNQQQKKINMEKKHTHIEKCSIFLTCINIDDVESWTGYYFFILKRDITLMVYLTSSSSLLIYLNLLFFFHLSSPLRSTFLFNRVSWI